MRFCLALFLLLFCALPCDALAQERETAGNYSFDLPEGYALRRFESNEAKFNKNLVINEVFEQKDSGAAIVYCLREKKTEYRSFALPAKERISLQTAPRRYLQMFISATEDVRHEEMWFKFSLLEEKSSNSREIKDRERFVVAIEMGAASDDYHTMLFVCDFRKIDGFFDVEEYKSQVTNTAVQVLDSIKKAQ